MPAGAVAAADLVVVGAGNAALNAALSAAEAGARVLILEKAPQEARGGNSYTRAACSVFHTRVLGTSRN
jgi:tricarballylate dehydrogenase